MWRKDADPVLTHYWDVDAATARPPSTGAGRRRRRGAYVFALTGTCSSVHVARTLTAVDVLRATRPWYPVTCMVSEACLTNPALRDALADARLPALPVKPVTAIGCAKSSTRQRGDRGRDSRYFDRTYTKLHVWNLTKYDAVLYLDSDVGVLRNLDHVLHRLLSNSSAGWREARTGQGCMYPHSSIPYINTGVWGVRPSASVHRDLLAFVASGASATCYDGDQSAAMAYFGRRHSSRDMLQARGRAALTAPPDAARSQHLPALPQLHTGYNLKANLGPTKCLRSRALNASHAMVIHWSGPGKPSSTGPTPTDPILRQATERYLDAFSRVWSSLNQTALGQTGALER